MQGQVGFQTHGLFGAGRQLLARMLALFGGHDINIRCVFNYMLDDRITFKMIMLGGQGTQLETQGWASPPC